MDINHKNFGLSLEIFPPRNLKASFKLWRTIEVLEKLNPKGMIDWVVNEASKLGWPNEAIHYEEFLAPKPGKPFQVKLSASNKVVNVGENESLLEAIEREGVDAPYLCRGGACGQCEK